MENNMNGTASIELNELLLSDDGMPPSQARTSASTARRGSTTAQHWLGGVVGVVAVAALAVAILAHGKQAATSHQASGAETASRINTMALQVDKAATSHPVCQSSDSQWSDCQDLSDTMRNVMAASISGGPLALRSTVFNGSTVRGAAVPFLVDPVSKLYYVSGHGAPFTSPQWDYLADPDPSKCVRNFRGGWCLKFLVNSTTNATFIAVVQQHLEGDSQVRTRRNAWGQGISTVEGGVAGSVAGTWVAGPPGGVVGGVAGSVAGFCSTRGACG